MKIDQSTLINLKESSIPADNNKEAQLHKACKDFESILIKQMLTAMRKSIPNDGLFPRGHADEMYQSMLDEEHAKNMAHGKGMGIGDALFDQLSGKSLKTTKEIL